MEEGLPAVEGSDGTIRAYEPESNIFGSYKPDGTTRTFYKPAGGRAYFEQQIDEDLSNGGRIINALPDVEGGEAVSGGGWPPIMKPGLNRNPFEDEDE